MKIDRHNYEEYFILYMDNELINDERLMVEAFVQNHPDLKEELDILLQYKLEPDTNIVFLGKDDLIKINGDTPINSNNYEEWFTFYIDNELTAQQKKSVEQFFIDNPSQKEELSILQKTKLQPEEIIFANKELLYRREGKVRRIPVLWWRVAAAVLIFAIGLTTAIILNNKPSGGTDVAKISGDEQKVNKESPVEIKAENKQVPLQVISNDVQNAVAATIKQTKNNPVVKKDNITSTPIKLKELIPAPVKKNEEAIANNNKPTNNLPQPINTRIINNTDPVVNTIAKNTPSKENNTIQNALTNPVVTNKSTQPSDIVQASLQNPNDAEMDQSTGKKSKLRGFFRKVTRTFEKRTNIDPTDNDERLLVGGLAIRLK